MKGCSPASFISGGKNMYLQFVLFSVKRRTHSHGHAPHLLVCHERGTSGRKQV